MDEWRPHWIWTIVSLWLFPVGAVLCVVSLSIHAARLDQGVVYRYIFLVGLVLSLGSLGGRLVGAITRRSIPPQRAGQITFIGLAALWTVGLVSAAGALLLTLSRGNTASALTIFELVAACVFCSGFALVSILVLTRAGAPDDRTDRPSME